MNVSIDQVHDELAMGDTEWDSLRTRIITALEADLEVCLDIEQTLEIEDEDIIEAVLGSN